MPEHVPSQIGRVRIVGMVGQWTAGSQAMGWLFRGHDDTFSREVLVKTLSPTEVDFGPAHPLRVSLQEARARFEREARITAKLCHPNIISVWELGFDRDGAPYMVFEDLEGQSLLQLMNAAISLRAGLPVILQVLDGLGHMHESGVIHRDIKPANVFVCADGCAKITDLFLAALVQPTMKGNATALRLATPFHISPELAMAEAFDARTDLFSLGCVLYEMSAGKKPFHGDNPVVVLFKVIQDDPDMGLIPDGPEWKRLRGVITRALQKKREDRYPDAAAMRADLELALKELGGSADWVPPPSSSPHPTRLH